MPRADRRAVVLRLLQDIVASVAQLERSVIARLLPVLLQAHGELERDLIAYLRRENGAATFTAQRYRRAILIVRTAIGEGRKLAPHALQALIMGAHRAGALSTEHMARELTLFGQIFEGTVHNVALDEAAILARGDRILIPQFRLSALRYAGDLRDSVVRELAVSRVRGETIFEATNRLQRTLPRVFEQQRFWAHRLARTETMNAYSLYHVEALREAARDAPDLKMRWDSTFDSRRCPMCRSLDGQVADVLKGEPFVARWTTAGKRGVRVHVVKVKRNPAHPLCRCACIPWRDSWPEYAQRSTPAAA